MASVAATFVGLDNEVPFQLDPGGRTRFVVENSDDGVIGKVYFGPDVYPGPGVADPNSALSMKAAVAHEISHFHRWRDATELPLGEYTHLDEALTSLDAALRFPRNLSIHEVEQLIRDAVHRLQLLRAELIAGASGKQGQVEPPLIFRTPQSEDNPRMEVFDAEATAVHGGVQA